MSFAGIEAKGWVAIVVVVVVCLAIYHYRASVKRALGWK
jgi:hypothetical protein